MEELIANRISEIIAPALAYVPSWVLPKRVPILYDDEVVTLPYTGSAIRHAKSLLSWTLRFDDVLDAARLQYALVQLANRPEWRILGGRVTEPMSERMEIRVPAKFSHDRPAVRCTHQEYEVDMEMHPLASQMPRSMGKPSIFPGAASFRTITSITPGETVIMGDEPLLSMHVTSFENSTLVSMKFPRLLVDMMDMDSLMMAWNMVLNDKEPCNPKQPADRKERMEKKMGSAYENRDNMIYSTMRMARSMMEPAMESRMVRMSEWSFCEMRQTSTSTPLLKEKMMRSGSFACPGEAEIFGEWLFRENKMILSDAANGYSGSFSSFENINLGPAALIPDREKGYPGARQPGRPNFSQIDMLDDRWAGSEQFQVAGKDSRGNIWMSGKASAESWKALDMEMSRWA